VECAVAVVPKNTTSAVLTLQQYYNWTLLSGNIQAKLGASAPGSVDKGVQQSNISLAKKHLADLHAFVVEKSTQQSQQSQAQQSGPS
jgi:hypothetical protein